jgi:serine/threonine protein kinase
MEGERNGKHDDSSGHEVSSTRDAAFDQVLRRVAHDGEYPAVRLPQPGDVLADRYRIEQRMCHGGMGTIYRGNDLSEQVAVAIKVMSSAAIGSFDEAQRFAREALVLAELSHPCIVRYRMHGTTARGLPFIAMDWLDGEDLAQRLVRAPLTAAESLTLLRRACEGLAVAHARGIVHRDIKPSNLFLVNGDPGSLKLLDFGVARYRHDVPTLTRAGAVLGTVGYMSPEQAMASPALDARTDVFALGCVLFECLTGRPAFVGPNAVAVLAKVLHEDPPVVSQLQSRLGDGLAELLARMLAKDPSGRPAGAAAVLRALQDLGAEVDRTHVIEQSAGLTATERNIVAVILGKTRTHDDSRSEANADAETIVPGFSQIRELAARFGAEPVALRGGAVIVVLSSPGAATDQAAQAARCALLLRRQQPELRLTIAMGRAETTGKIPIGDAIDRAAELLTAMAEPTHGVAIDELTAGLLEPSFVVEREAATLVVVEERTDQENARLLMGKPTPFVGRDKELALLELTLRECIEDSVARVVLVTGPPGQGKSRLRQEFVHKARQYHDLSISIARADPFAAGSAFLLVRALVRHAIGLREGDGATQQLATLHAHVADLCETDEVTRITEFLGELIGVPAANASTPELRAARNDPQIMSVWLRRSFGAWLAAFCIKRPLVIVLEDLHWGDSASVAYLDAALRELKACPLMVLAIARPEVSETFPKLWIAAERQEIALGRLTPRAAEGLVREVLGAELEQDTVTHIIERADGNPFYLEELVRRVAEGDRETLPETVLALVQSRLERIDPEARRVVRAASIFGEVFWRGGVAAVLGRSMSTRDLDAWLETLEEHELLGPGQRSRFPAEIEYTFRHGLLREAAYAMLTSADLATGHASAGDWLERNGEKDALRLAEHFERGGDRVRALPWLVSAAQTAADGGDTVRAVALCDRCIASGAQNTERGRMRLVQAQASWMTASWHESVELAREGLALLPAGSAEWFTGIAFLLVAGSFTGDPSVAAHGLQELLSVGVQSDRSGPYGFATCTAAQGLAMMGQADTARMIIERADGGDGNDAKVDPVFLLWVHNARAFVDLATGQLGSAVSKLRTVRSLAEKTGAMFARTMGDLYMLSALCQTGHLEQATDAAQDLFESCAPIGLASVTSWTTFFLAWTNIVIGHAADAIAPLRGLLDRPDMFLATSARAALSQALLACGESIEAEREAITAMNDSLFPWNQAMALRSLALVALRLERPENALALADRGLAAAATGGYPATTSTLHFARCEALLAQGRHDDARLAIRLARDRLRQMGNSIDDDELRTSFLTRIEVHAHTFALGRTWLADQ